MIVTSITPCIKVTKENNMSGIDMYIEEGDKVIVTDIQENVVSGRVLFLELGIDVEEDDILHLSLDNESRFNIGVSYIKNIDIL